MVDKKKRLPRASRIGFVVSGLLLTGLQAEVRLPALFTHHMVLQRDIPITIWGWAAPGEAGCSGSSPSLTAGPTRSSWKGRIGFPLKT